METKIDLGFQTHAVQNTSYHIREETFEDRKYIVVPVVMMKEGVHSGNKGPILHREEELKKFTEAWNGIPVTVQHPTKNGVAVSANSPQILEEYKVGMIFNTYYEDGLKAEAWIDVEKIQDISMEALGAIRQGHPLDVSVGVFSEAIPTEGEWEGETYGSIAVNYRPNHLALLPGETGACSWDDGCGIRTNKKGEGMNKEQIQVFKDLAKQGLAVAPITNEQGFREILENLHSEIGKMDTDDTYHFIEEVYSDYIVYRKRIFDGGGETLYRQDYSIDDQGNILFNGMATEVRKKVEYVTMKMVRTTISNNKNEGGQNMSEESKPCCEAKVDALIANKDSKFEAKDREWLLGLNEQQLEKLTPSEPEVQANAAEAIETFKSTLRTEEDFMGIMPESMAARFREGITAYDAKREALVQGILDNADKDIWTKEALEALSDEVLEGISKSVSKKPANYAGQGTPATHSSNGGGDGKEAKMIPAHILAQKKKEE